MTNRDSLCNVMPLARNCCGGYRVQATDQHAFYGTSVCRDPASNAPECDKARNILRASSSLAALDLRSITSAGHDDVAYFAPAVF
jgi:hypothetical protein